MTERDSLTMATPEQVGADLLVFGCCEGEAPPAEGFPAPIRLAVEALAGRRGWEGKEKQYVEAPVSEGSVAVVALQGLGKASELNSRKLSAWIAAVAERGQNNGIERLGLHLPPHRETRGRAAARRVTRSAGLASYRFDLYLTDPRSQQRRLETVELVPPPGEEESYRQAIAAAGPVAAGAALARDLANTPPNVAHPAWMEEQARALAESRDIALTVLGRRELEERGMGGILAVASGSAREPRLLRLEWGHGERCVALVGKGVTFDTGGISIKPSVDMDEMKYDKAGACAVLGIVRAVTDLGLPVRVRAYVPLVENMPDGLAYRPGDIVRCYNGKTVEILNTDAEGRMILADALAWAAEEGADELLELSTLTGASVIALGHLGAALYTPDDALAGELLEASETSGERLWRMPVWPEFVEQMKGTHADLKNTGSRWGSANTAAAFLSQFVGDLRRWAHLDIAGAAYVGRDREEPRGATGYGVALVVDWLRREAEARPGAG